jgi:monofunctional biosynthetic peptidoglycan transglycosylase
MGWLLVKLVTWPNVAALATENPKSTAFIDRYEKQRKHDKKMPAARWKWVSWGAISPSMKRAAVVAEDVEFFSHDGFSRREIKAAIEKAMEKKEMPRGASTITQQLAKNLWLSPSRNPLRKFEEAILTRQLERELSKKRILEIYLNVVEFGPGIYGAEAAARAYFGKSAAALGPREAASLAAGLPKPSKWHPGSGSRYYAKRTGRIERMMARASFLGRYVGGGAPVEVASSDTPPSQRETAGSPITSSPPSTSPMASGPVEASPTPGPILPPPAPDPVEAPASPDSTRRLEQLMQELKEDMEAMQREDAEAESAQPR